MIKMSLAYWCRISTALNGVAGIKGGDPFPEAYAKIMVGGGSVLANHNDNSLVRLVASRTAALEFVTLAQKFTETPTRESPITVEEATALQNAAKKYQGILEAELENVDAYYVKQKSIYSTPHLIEAAETILPPEIAAILPSAAKADLQDAGRSLAFELPTAAGFHTARATEVVICELMEALGCPEGKENQRNWGAYIKALKEKGADSRITHQLEQIKDLHRNPLIHPEVTLTMPEALSLWTICTSLIAVMLEAAGRARATPAEAI